MNRTVSSRALRTGQDSARALLLMVCGLMMNCGARASEDDTRTRVVATIPPVADWCEVLLDDARVYTLLQPGQTPHGYEPTPGHARRVAEADVVVGWGGAIDDWLVGLVDTASPSATTIWLYRQPERGRDSTSNHTHRQLHAHEGDGNPHAWLDPADARRTVEDLAAHFTRAFPDQATAIEARAAAYDVALADLEGRTRRAATTWEGGAVVTLHDAWPHFLRACGLRSLGSVQAASGAPPSSQALARLVEALRRQSVRVIIAEPQVSPTLAQAVAREADARVLLLDPLGRDGMAGYDSYLAMMHSNLDTLEEAFGEIPDS